MRTFWFERTEHGPWTPRGSMEGTPHGTSEQMARLIRQDYRQVGDAEKLPAMLLAVTTGEGTSTPPSAVEFNIVMQEPTLNTFR